MRVPVDRYYMCLVCRPSHTLCVCRVGTLGALINDNIFLSYLSTFLRRFYLPQESWPEANSFPP